MRLEKLGVLDSSHAHMYPTQKSEGGLEIRSRVYSTSSLLKEYQT